MRGAEYWFRRVHHPCGPLAKRAKAWETATRNFSFRGKTNCKRRKPAHRQNGNDGRDAGNIRHVPHLAELPQLRR